VDFSWVSEVNRIKALMIYLANLTVRRRLDRLDGVGEIAWAGDHAVDSTIRGFLAGMKAQVEDGMCDDMLVRQFLPAAKGLSPGELAEIFQIVTDSYDEDAPDLPVILDHLVDHILQVYRVLQELHSCL